MKTRKVDLKSLKGALSREEMKAVRGGDVITCTNCSGLDTGSCWAKYCHSTNCWVMQDGEDTFLCQCSGGCGE
jgi:hypothetical protein